MALSFEQIQQTQKCIAKEINSAQWSCEACTFINKSSANQCEVCTTPYHQSQFFLTSNSTKYTQHTPPQSNDIGYNYQNGNNFYTANYTENTQENYDEYYYQENAYDIDDGAEYCDYDEVDWDAAKKRLTRTKLVGAKKKKKRKKKKKEVSPTSAPSTTTITTTINSLNTTITNSAASISSANNDDNKEDEQEIDKREIPGLQMIYNEKTHSVERVTIKTHHHPLRIRIMLSLNHDGYCNHNHKAWTLHTTGYNTSYKRYNYLLGSCRVDIYDEYLQKYWDSVTFLPCKQRLGLKTSDRLNIVNNASIPIFTKIKNNEFVEMDRRGIIRDMDTCILYYIAQYALESRLRYIKDKTLRPYQKWKYNLLMTELIQNGIEWNVKTLTRNKQMIDYKSPIQHRKLWKLFDKYIPNMHMLFHVIFEFLGYDRITTLMIEGKAELKDITDAYLQRIAYSDEFIPRMNEKDKKSVKRVYENDIEYDIDEAMLKMDDNGQTVKHYMNVAMDVNESNIGCNLKRHSPFKNNNHFAESIWVQSQDPMKNVLKKSDKLRTVFHDNNNKRYRLRFSR